MRGSSSSTGEGAAVKESCSPDVEHGMVAGAELGDDEEVGVLEDDALPGDPPLEGAAQLVGQHLVIPGK